MSFFNSTIQSNIGFFELRGQSNATGNCPLSELPSKFSRQTIDARHYNILNSTWEQQVLGGNAWGTPSDWQSQYPTPVFGIEAELMRLLIDYYNVPQFMFKWTWPGSNIDSWIPTGSNNYYTRSKTAYLDAVQKLPFNQPLKASIWIQGESNVNEGASYVTKLTNIIAADRVYKGNRPFVIVSLSTGQTYINSTQLAAFKVTQRSMAQYVLELDGVTVTTQSGVNVISNVWFIDQNEPCKYQVAGIIHYSALGNENIANKVFAVIKRFY